MYLSFSNTVLPIMMAASTVFAASGQDYNTCVVQKLKVYGKFPQKAVYAQAECMWRFGMKTKVGHPVANLGNGALGEKAKAFG